MADLETEVKLLKKELEDQRKIHDRLDVAIEKLTDVSNSIYRMLAVHEEKLSRQEEALERVAELKSLHSYQSCTPELPQIPKKSWQRHHNMPTKIKRYKKSERTLIKELVFLKNGDMFS